MACDSRRRGVFVPANDAGRGLAMSRAIGYRQALVWLVLNDDTEWLEDENGSLSVTAALVADIYGKSDSQVTDDLRKLKPQRDSLVLTLRFTSS